MSDMAKLELRHLDAPYGAEVRGLDPGVPIDEETWARLRRFFDERGLLLFRELDCTFPQQQTIVDHLVEGEDSLATIPAAHTEGNFVSNRVDEATSSTGKLSFHTDAMWSDETFELVSLHALDVDPAAAPTTFASMDVAWQTLPAELRTRIEGLHVYQGEGQIIDDDRRAEEYASNVAQAQRGRVTPIDWRHPRTGRPLLYISEQQTREIVELPAPESEELLAALRTHLYSTTNVIEHHWHDGDLAAWDNFAVQHGRPNVTRDGPARTLRRATVPAGWLWKVVYDTRTVDAAG
jgi:taurine dioxygenase